MVDLAGQVPGGINGDVGVVAVDLHAQSKGHIGHLDADGAQADHAQPLILQLRADELFFPLFHLFGQGRRAGGTGQVLHPLGGGHQVAAAHHQGAHHQLGHRSAVGTGGIEDHDALLAAPVQGDIVDAGPRPGNGQQVGVQLHLMHIGAAHQNAVRGIGVHRHVKQVLVQLSQAHRADGVQSLDGIHILNPLCYAFSLRNFSMKSTSLSTPSAGIAL